MIKILGSIKDFSEAEQVKDIKFDITDLKSVNDGALGYVGDSEIIKIKNILKNRTLSVTAGNNKHPGCDELISRVSFLDGLGISYVKVGFFDKAYIKEHEYFLQSVSSYKIKKVGVLFAENINKFYTINEILSLNYDGFMIDTQNKDNRSSLDILGPSLISDFITKCKMKNKFNGLSGSLDSKILFEIMKFNSNFIGFRGALCCNSNRQKISYLNSNFIINKVKLINQKMYPKAV